MRTNSLYKMVKLLNLTSFLYIPVLNFITSLYKNEPGHILSNFCHHACITQCKHHTAHDYMYALVYT